MSEQFAPPSRLPPRRGNAGDGGGGEIRALSPSPAGLGFDDWRRDLGVLKERGRVRHKIFWILFEYVSSDYEEEMAEFSIALEEALLAEAIDKESYLDQLSFSTRVHRLIQCTFIDRIIHKKGTYRARCILHPSPAATSKAQNGTGRSHSLMLCNDNVNQPHSRFRSATSSGSKGKGFGLGVSASDMIRKQASGTISSTDEENRRKRAFCIAETSPIGHKRFKEDNLLSKISCIPGIPTAVYSPDGPLSMQQTLLSNTSSNSGVIELTMEVDTVHGEQPVNSAIRKESTDHLLRSNAGEVHNVAEVLPADCGKIEPTRTWDVIFESEVSFGTVDPKIVPNLSQEQHIAEKDDTVVTAEFDEALPEINTELLRAEKQHVVEKEDVIMAPSDEIVPKTNAGLMAQGQQSSDYEGVIITTKAGEVVAEINTEALAEGQHVDEKQEVMLTSPSAETVSEAKGGLLTQEQNSADKEDIMVVAEFDDTVSEVHAPLVPSSNAQGACVMPEKQIISRVSLIEFFTADEVSQHLQSLKPSNQSAAEEVFASASCEKCQLCYSNNLNFAPLPIYCSLCSLRIKDGVTYYSMVDKNGACTCICSKCYKEAHGGNIKMVDHCIPKSKLEEKKNNAVTEESWVQCDKCDKWQHQICALIIDKENVEGKAKYICPKCYLEELKSGDRFPDPQRIGIGARDLPSTKLSAHIEDWLFYYLQKEREERAKAVGKGPDEVPGADGLTVRVVSSVDKELKVKQRFLDIFPDKRYPKQFPYRSKVINLFQRIEGVDVCIFTMYVQEFGSKSSAPNRRCVNIAYIDSVKYFRPELKTTKGEALRTFVYHQVLNGYLDYCKKRGFAICYIWVCPPVKGENYILHRHPPEQKTPVPWKLKLWYDEMLKKAIEQNAAVHSTNLWNSIFVSDTAYMSRITAARLPYDGDYLSGIVEGVINKILEDSDRDISKKFEQIQRRSLRARGHTNPLVCDPKEVILMDELYCSMEQLKDHFFVIYLHFICNSCNEVILSGSRWFCKTCKNYQLCEGCHQRDSHMLDHGQGHKLFKGSSEEVPVDTEDNDVILDKSIMESRDAFLSLCQENFYQFDTVRRAKHSSTMILYHLHKKNGSVSNVDDLAYHTLPVNERPVTVNAAKEMGTSDILLHAFKCRLTDQCTNPDCRILKLLILHTKECKVRLSGGCRYCRRMLMSLAKHAKNCKDTNCGIPKCKDVGRYPRSIHD